MAVATARHLQHAAQPADGALVAMGIDTGVLHRDPLAKYAVGFSKDFHVQLRVGQLSAQAAASVAEHAARAAL